MSLRALLVSAACCLAAVPAAAAQAAPRVRHTPATLRIGLWTLWHDQQLTAAPAAGSAPTVRPCSTCAPVRLPAPVTIRADGSVLHLSGHRDASSIILSGPIVLSAHGETLTLNHPLAVSAHDGRLVLAVTLPIESYVARVVASESGPADSLESLKALAVVVRSFALHQQHAHTDYDLCDSTHCQFLHWSAAPSPSARAATLATAGETLWYHGHPAAAWFHRDCGGRTASPSELWPRQRRELTAPSGNTFRPASSLTPNPNPLTSSPHPLSPAPWLASRPDPYCSANGVRSWSADLSLADLTTALAAAGLVRPGWRTLNVARRGDAALGQSPRAVTLFAGSTQISAEDFRLAVGRAFGWGHILSTWFEIVPEGDRFVFNGRGSGHGVGLCQHGAAVMASQGRGAAEILAQYFPGAEALDESSGRPWTSLAVRGAAPAVVLNSLDAADASYLPAIAKALAAAEASSGLQLSGSLTIRAYPSTAAFRSATLASGWVAAFAEGNFIATQPLATLSSRHLLLPTLRHEFLHALLEAHSSPSAPLWLREGMVEVLSDPTDSAHIPSTAVPGIPLDRLDASLAHPASEAESTAAHRAASAYTGRLVARYGRAQVLEWLASSLPVAAKPEHPAGATTDR